MRQKRKTIGILTRVRINTNTIQTATHMDDFNVHVLNIGKNNFNMKLVNFYSPNDNALSIDSTQGYEYEATLSNHSLPWGYDTLVGEIDTWQNKNNLNLNHSPYDPPTFYSRSTTSIPDLVFYSDYKHGHVKRAVYEQLECIKNRQFHLTMNIIDTISSTVPIRKYRKIKWA